MGTVSRVDTARAAHTRVTVCLSESRLCPHVGCAALTRAQAFWTPRLDLMTVSIIQGATGASVTRLVEDGAGSAHCPARLPVSILRRSIV